MDIFGKEHNIAPKVLQSINRVRCHLKVFSIADIATGDGLKIRKQYMLGLVEDTDSSWEWPLERPSSNDFKCWREAMNLLLDETKLLTTPVGCWIAKPHLTYHWYYCAENDTIYYLIIIHTLPIKGVMLLPEQIRSSFAPIHKLHQLAVYLSPQ